MKDLDRYEDYERCRSWCARCILARPDVTVLTGYGATARCARCGHRTDLALIRLPNEPVDTPPLIP